MSDSLVGSLNILISRAKRRKERIRINMEKDKEPDIMTLDADATIETFSHSFYEATTAIKI